MKGLFSFLVTFSLLGLSWGVNYRVTEQVFFDMSVGGQPAGRIEIGLFGDVVPRTVKNFATICQGFQGRSYSGSKFHRVIKNFMNQGGDIINGDGTGSYSIYGSAFEDENFEIPHKSAGIMSMANSGPNTNGCQFFMTAAATPWLDGKHVVFGKVVRGLDLAKRINNAPTRSDDSPVKPVVIARCGVILINQPYDISIDE